MFVLHQLPLAPFVDISLCLLARYTNMNNINARRENTFLHICQFVRGKTYRVFKLECLSLKTPLTANIYFNYYYIIISAH